jgi:hypothetical protein
MSKMKSGCPGNHFASIENRMSFAYNKERANKIRLQMLISHMQLFEKRHCFKYVMKNNVL